MADDNTFKIALCMAGAISGGAYTAGVLDFLFEALNEWEKAKAAGDPDVPDHNVVLTAIAGASAGSICAALLPIALAKREKPRTVKILGREETVFLPTLYDAWVVKPRFIPELGAGGLMGDADLRPNREIVSLLDTTILNDVGRNAVAPAANVDTRASSPNVARNLHAFITLGNLRGVLYKIEFQGDKDQPAHGIRLHADRAHIAFSGAGVAPQSAGEFATAETPDLVIDAATLPRDVEAIKLDEFESRKNDGLWERFISITLGSAAVPGALRTRRIVPGKAAYEGRSWPLDVDSTNPSREAKIRPDWESDYDPNFDHMLGPRNLDELYEYQTIDGGTFNNEPFEIARRSLFEPKDGMRNPPSDREANRAVLMIDPFPEPPSVDPRSWQRETGLVATLLGIPGAFKNQSRFKAQDLVRTLDETVFSRFLVAPIRREAGAPAAERFALACGLLGGFGGFLDQRLRDHDFVLGRRNCQNFLRHHFVLHKDNLGVFGRARDSAADIAEGVDIDPASPDFRRIVPLCGSAMQEIALPARPRIEVMVVRRFAEVTGARLEKIIDRLSRDFGGFFGWLVRQIGWLIGERKIRTASYQFVQADLIRRDQIDFTSDPLLVELARANSIERHILAAFCSLSEGWRTAQEIAKAAGFSDERLARGRDEIDEIAKLFPDFVERSGHPGDYRYRAKLYWRAPA